MTVLDDKVKLIRAFIVESGIIMGFMRFMGRSTKETEERYLIEGGFVASLSDVSRSRASFVSLVASIEFPLNDAVPNYERLPGYRNRNKRSVFRLFNAAHACCVN